MRFIKLVAIVSVSISLILGLLCYFVHWQYGTSLMWAGAVIIVLGMMSAMGSRNVTGQYNLKYDQSVIHQYNYERNEQNLSDELKSYDFCLLMAAIGIALIVAGVVINKLV